MALGRRKSERQGSCGLRRRMCREARGIRSTRSPTGYWLKLSSTRMSNPSVAPSTRRTSAALASRPACTSGCCLWATSRASTRNGGLRGGVRILCRSSRSWATPWPRRHARESREDCNSNGFEDSLEIGPFDGFALDFDGVDDYVELPGSWPDQGGTRPAAAASLR